MKPELEIADLESKIPTINTENAAFAAGDHWQDGAGWTGPTPDAESENAGTYMTRMEEIFVSSDVLNEIRKRERWALTGKAWTWALMDSENKPMSEGDAEELRGFIEAWLVEKQIVSVVADAIEKSSWSGDEGIDGRGLLRFFIPQQRLEGGRAQAEDIGQAMNLIELECPDSETGVVFEDADSEYEPVGFIKWSEEKEGNEFERAELVYINEAGETVLENLIDSEFVDSAEVATNLGGRLTMYQLSRPLLITKSLRSQQKFLNHINTAYQAGVMGAAWPEDFFFGLMPPGKYVDDPSEPSGKRYVPDLMMRGPGRSHFFQPNVFVDKDGVEKPVSASHTGVGTMSPHLFTTAMDDLRSSMLQESFQEYTLLTGLAQASSEKLQLAKGDFEASATDMANETRLMVTWVMETVIALAESIMGAGEPTGTKVMVDVQIDTGIVTVEQQLILAQLWRDGFISQKTALAKAGYANPDAEIAKIEQEGGPPVTANISKGGTGQTPEGEATGQTMRTEVTNVERPTPANTSVEGG